MDTPCIDHVTNRISEHHEPVAITSPPLRIHQVITVPDNQITLREARIADAAGIRKLFDVVYQGKYPLDSGSSNDVITFELGHPDQFLWVVAELTDDASLVGCMSVKINTEHRLGKAGSGVVLPAYRHYGLAASMLKMQFHYLTQTNPCLDVIYGTTRTISESPMRMVAEAGCKQMGILPNAVHIKDLEHLNIDVFMTNRALKARRKMSQLFRPFEWIYHLAAQEFDLEIPDTVIEALPVARGKKSEQFTVLKDTEKVAERFQMAIKNKTISPCFSPFDDPNWLLSTPDGQAEIFVYYSAAGKQATIIAYCARQADNLHHLFSSAANVLDEEGAAYVEILVSAHDLLNQQYAYAARYLPSAYLPAFMLSSDGFRDDYLILSRTFRQLDFTDAHISERNVKFLRCYLSSYYQLYIQPILGPLGVEVKNEAH